MFEILPEADQEAYDAALWYHRQRAGLGEQFLEEYRRTIARIMADPSRFGRVERCPNTHDIRRCQFHRFPYLVYYLLRHEEILVVAISHARRRPLYWIDRLK